MRKPDDEFISHFRKRFGDLLLSCNDESRKGSGLVDAGDPMLPVSYANDNALVSTMQVDNANSAQTLGLVHGSPFSRQIHTPDSLSPMIVSKKHKTSHNQTLPGSGAVFHNNAGDLHSPMIQWDLTTSPLFDGSIHDATSNSWVGRACFTPLAQTQYWLCDNTQDGQRGNLPGFLTRDDSGDATVNGHNMLTHIISEQTDLKYDLAASEGDFTRDPPFGNGEEYA
jgi:hypothetical protein